MQAVEGGTSDIGYSASVKERTAQQGTGPFRGGGTSIRNYSNYDLSLRHINSYGQGSSHGSYTARGGETLSMVAATLWGDSSLWYKLAEANGLSASATLAAGQTLTVPSGVTKNTHNASTFMPYDPSQAMGDTSLIAPTIMAKSLKERWRTREDSNLWPLPSEGSALSS